MNFETLRNKFDKLREDWAEDSAVDFQFKNKQYTTDLGQLALSIPFQHNKYLNHYTDIQQIKTSSLPSPVMVLHDMVDSGPFRR